MEQYQKLSEYLITKYSDNLNWYLLSQYQYDILTEQMIDNHIKELDFYELALHYKLSEK